MNTNPKLMFASSKNSDMFYRVHTTIPDPCFFLEFDDRKLVFLDKRDIGAFIEQDTEKRFEAIPLEIFFAKAREKELPKNGLTRVALAIIHEYLPKEVTIEVPIHFPLDLADALRSESVKLQVKNPFYPERAIKDEKEINTIEDTIKRTCNAYKKIEEILTQSVIKDNHIIYSDAVLTSEFLKQEVDSLFFRDNLLNIEGIIISSGAQAAMPHNMGSGPILANEPIVCDIFPRDRKTGYFADMTRTYVKGKASDEMKKIYEIVKEAQEKSIVSIKPGSTGEEAHQICVDIFLKAGYHVGDEGFVHGTGHGLGLDVHEGPYLSQKQTTPLVVGNVVTVEPGLYYEGVGSTRIEDVVVVTENGSRNLTNYPKVLEIH